LRGQPEPSSTTIRTLRTFVRFSSGVMFFSEGQLCISKCCTLGVSLTASMLPSDLQYFMITFRKRVHLFKPLMFFSLWVTFNSKRSNSETFSRPRKFLRFSQDQKVKRFSERIF